MDTLRDAPGWGRTWMPRPGLFSARASQIMFPKTCARAFSSWGGALSEHTDAVECAAL